MNTQGLAKRLLPWIILLSGMLQGSQSPGYVDEIRINNRAFESLDRREITFYVEDLQQGRIVVTGLLESEDDTVPVSALQVEISVDGGMHWKAAEGHDVWRWSFRPETGRAYEFALRVVQQREGVKVVTTSPMAVTFKSFRPKVLTTGSLSLQFKGFRPVSVTTAPMRVGFRQVSSKVVTTAPLGVAFKTPTPTVVTTGTLQVRFVDPGPEERLTEATTEPLRFRFVPVPSRAETTPPLRVSFTPIAPQSATTAPLQFGFAAVARKTAATRPLRVGFDPVASRSAVTGTLRFGFREEEQVPSAAVGRFSATGERSGPKVLKKEAPALKAAELKVGSAAPGDLPAEALPGGVGAAAGGGLPGGISGAEAAGGGREGSGVVLPGDLGGYGGDRSGMHGKTGQDMVGGQGMKDWNPMCSQMSGLQHSGNGDIVGRSGYMKMGAEDCQDLQKSWGQEGSNYYKGTATNSPVTVAPRIDNGGTLGGEGGKEDTSGGEQNKEDEEDTDEGSWFSQSEDDEDATDDQDADKDDDSSDDDEEEREEDPDQNDDETGEAEGEEQGKSDARGGGDSPDPADNDDTMNVPLTADAERALQRLQGDKDPMTPGAKGGEAGGSGDGRGGERDDAPDTSGGISYEPGTYGPVDDERRDDALHQSGGKIKTQVKDQLGGGITPIER